MVIKEVDVEYEVEEIFVVLSVRGMEIHTTIAILYMGFRTKQIEEVQLSCALYSEPEIKRK